MKVLCTLAVGTALVISGNKESDHQKNSKYKRKDGDLIMEFAGAVGGSRASGAYNKLSQTEV